MHLTRYIPAFALLAMLWGGTAHADDMMDDGMMMMGDRADGVYYAAISGVLRSDLEIGGNLNAYEETAAGYMLAAGYRFDDWLSTELAYMRGNDYERRGPDDSGKAQVEIWELAGLISYPPLTRTMPRLHPYARLAWIYADAKDTSKEATKRSDNDNMIVWGVGVDYTLASGRYLRLDYTEGGFDSDESLERLTLGLVVDFN